MQNQEQSETELDEKIEDRIYPEKYLRKLFRPLDPAIDTINQNLDRASNLVEIYRTLYGEGKGRRSVPKVDLLPAAVVFIHASLEDFLRALAAISLPNADEDILNSIPLKDLNITG